MCFEEKVLQLLLVFQWENLIDIALEKSANFKIFKIYHLLEHAFEFVKPFSVTTFLVCQAEIDFSRLAKVYYFVNCFLTMVSILEWTVDVTNFWSRSPSTYDTFELDQFQFKDLDRANIFKCQQLTVLTNFKLLELQLLTTHEYCFVIFDTQNHVKLICDP